MIGQQRATGGAAGVGVGLHELCRVLRPGEEPRLRDVLVEGLADHSDRVRPGDLFFAVPGDAIDGSAFAAQAVQKGAVAVVAARPLNLPVPVVVVGDVRVALARLAAHHHRDPGRVLELAGVTGTNGKTTVVQMLRACLEAAGRSTGSLGTVEYRYAGRVKRAVNTTPGSLQLHQILRDMVDNGVHACAMEVSSHALDQRRVDGVDFDVAVFTNLGRDHLDYHGDLARYADAKARLFEMLRPGAVACLNEDDPMSWRMAAALDGRVGVLTHGTGRDADVRAASLCVTAEGTRFDLVMPRGTVELLLPVVGVHNVRNALAVAAAALALGVSELTIAAALERFTPVRGRLELAGDADGVRAFVDYAHTPEALLQVCRALRPHTAGRLIAVFGCGGDRDAGKRPRMAAVVADHVDVAVLTSDNPRSEDPEAILDQMEVGLAGRAGEFYRITDRAAAIRHAVALARSGDVVLVAGKGHETVQVLRDTVLPFDDAAELRGALAERPSLAVRGTSRVDGTRRRQEVGR